MLGLGNPGVPYAATRHNVGFWVLERLIPQARWARESHPWGEVYRGQNGLLVRPCTYMNRAGEAVQGLLRCFPLSSPDILLVYDDADLPLGAVRLRPGGGPGTHRGMRSVLEALGTEQVPRLRIGIGKPKARDWAEYVLSPPSPEEAGVLARAADFAAELAWTFLDAGLAAAMDRLSRAQREQTNV